jgi:hypothetical protein
MEPLEALLSDVVMFSSKEIRSINWRMYGALVRIFHELLSRDREDGRATWQPQGVGFEAYLNGTSAGAGT